MGEKFTLISYGPDIIEHHTRAQLDDLLAQVQEDRISWVILHGCNASDQDDIENLLSFFSVDPIFVEKIIKEGLMGFSEEGHDCLFFKYSIPSHLFDRSQNAYEESRGSLILGKRYLLIFDETGSGFFDKTQQSLQNGKTRAQKFEVDYLLYLLMRDALYQIEQLVFIELIKRFEDLEDEIIANPGEDENLDKLLVNREFVKGLYEPMRGIDLFLTTIREQDLPLISPETLRLITQNLGTDLKDLERGFIRLGAWTSELLNLHRANIGERTNNIIYALTILSTIFLPLTFISGVYGMNFVFMPGLDHPFGYYGILLLMLVIVLGMLIIMKRKGWL